MTEIQEQMAVTALNFVAEHNGVCTKNDLLRTLRLRHGDDNLARASRVIVIDKLTQEIPLIRILNNLASLTENGETAQRMGFEQYMRRLHGNNRLDIRLKRMEFWIKLIELLDKSKVLIVTAFIVLYLLTSLFLWVFSRLVPTLGQAMLFLSGMALGALLIHILSVHRGCRRKRA